MQRRSPRTNAPLSDKHATPYPTNRGAERSVSSGNRDCSVLSLDWDTIPGI